MINEKVCGAVVYTKIGNEIYYLIIKNESGHTGFPKGHVEDGETELQTAQREILEETSLTPNIDISFREEYDYIFNGNNKNAVYFIAEFNNTEIKTQESEIFDHWLVPFEHAYELLNFKEDRAILKKADVYLKKEITLYL
jgi:bis(5'-nucleosidyl)-tetraphosphatase